MYHSSLMQFKVTPEYGVTRYCINTLLKSDALKLHKVIFDGLLSGVARLKNNLVVLERDGDGLQTVLQATRQSDSIHVQLASEDTDIGDAIKNSSHSPIGRPVDEDDVVYTKLWPLAVAQHARLKDRPLQLARQPHALLAGQLRSLTNLKDVSLLDLLAEGLETSVDDIRKHAAPLTYDFLVSTPEVLLNTMINVVKKSGWFHPEFYVAIMRAATVHIAPAAFVRAVYSIDPERGLDKLTPIKHDEMLSAAIAIGEHLAWDSGPEFAQIVKALKQYARQASPRR